MSTNEPVVPTVVPPIEAPVVPPTDPNQEMFEKMRADNKTYQDQLKAKNDELEKMKMDKLKEAKNWQEIARIKEEEAVQAKKNETDLRQAIVNQQKSIALRSAATKSGINPISLDDLDLIDFPELVVETTSTGKILVTGADAAILKLKTLRPNWFLKNPSAVNPASPEVMPTNGQVTLETLSALEKEYKKNPMNLVARRAYEEGIRKYKGS